MPIWGAPDWIDLLRQDPPPTARRVELERPAPIGEGLTITDRYGRDHEGVRPPDQPESTFVQRDHDPHSCLAASTPAIIDQLVMAQLSGWWPDDCQHSE